MFYECNGILDSVANAHGYAEPVCCLMRTRSVGNYRPSFHMLQTISRTVASVNTDGPSWLPRWCTPVATSLKMRKYPYFFLLYALRAIANL